ncbi:uncharacterized protein ASPGLDRAFT_1083201 [Aspergillus glaucus CBS 516.65]|uniref:Uncharacterized protein n=1 Tax=Aspergillus glaucus CBS 516.65 TaxID=1160497 RepID=A0A1L9V4W7_ASPGL|nr:hypothetical protein ASPGLDRAFT_1083201 [Aspergillus glaucus CBS 516.65]OJJ78950.1 hypothetical protein ASPGLDRAFT_1083201 [Aspergillus glaucus CBS 516.65]
MNCTLSTDTTVYHSLCSIFSLLVILILLCSVPRTVHCHTMVPETPSGSHHEGSSASSVSPLSLPHSFTTPLYPPLSSFIPPSSLKSIIPAISRDQSGNQISPVLLLFWELPSPGFFAANNPH